jgi:predicted dehydrogenase
VLGQGQTPPSEKLNIAGIGVGGMGRNNVKACENENIVALCDVDWEFSAPILELYPKAERHHDFRRMFDKQKNIDAVIVATADHTHAIASMTAIKLGKHVYCQKPLTHSVYEARKLAEAAREAGVATQMGNQGHSSERIRLVVEWIRAGVIGDVREVHVWTNRPGSIWGWRQGVERPAGTPPVPEKMDWDCWLGPAPERPYHPAYHPSKWRGFKDFGTGSLGDMGCHIIDQPYWALDLKSPASVEACSTAPVHSAEANEETYPLASIVTYQFAARGTMPPVKMVWYDGGMLPPRPEELEKSRDMSGDTGVLFVGDKGKMLNGRLIPESRMKGMDRPAKTIERIEGTHEQNWIDACKGGPAACSNFDYAGLLTETVLLGNVAVQAKKKIYWDAENLRVTNDNEANRFIQREYRKGWAL